MLARRATHCKKGGDTKHSYTHRVAVEQLLTCYSSNKTSNTRETDCRHVPAQNHSSPVTLRSSSASRLSEQRLRPRTCTACRSCMNPAPRSSVHSAATSTSLPPLDQPKHLPYYPGKANESRPKVRHKNRAAGKVTPVLTTLLPGSCNALGLNCNSQGNMNIIKPFQALAY
ncbi:hypothetical protein FKM82_005825 [Ascaphus truei]